VFRQEPDLKANQGKSNEIVQKFRTSPDPDVTLFFKQSTVALLYSILSMNLNYDKSAHILQVVRSQIKYPGW
jgi:hypothetical protein